MGRPIGPTKIDRYSVEFKRTVVELGTMPGVQLQTVANALEVHPFVLSPWRKRVRDGVPRGLAKRIQVEGKPVRELKRLGEEVSAARLLRTGLD
jgi:transposase